MALEAETYRRVEIASCVTIGLHTPWHPGLRRAFAIDSLVYRWIPSIIESSHAYGMAASTLFKPVVGCSSRTDL